MALSDETKELRRIVQKAFTSRCIYLSKDSLSYLADYVKDFETNDRQSSLKKIIEVIEKEEGQAELLDLARLKEIVVKSVRGRAVDKEAVFKLENSGQWTRTEWDKSFTKASLQDKENQSTSFVCLRQRFQLVQRLLDEKAKCCDSIENLFALSNTQVKVLGMLSRGSGDKLMLEDPTGNVRLDIGVVNYTPGIYFEGGIYIVEGFYNANEIAVDKISLPVLKSVTDRASTSEQRNNRENIRPSSNDRIVLLSDVFLDNPKVMKSVYHILSGFASCPPNMFIFCGSFLGTQMAYGYTEASTTAFRHLANIISEFSANYVDTQFIFIPSLDDPPPMSIFPCFALPPSVRECFKNAPNVHFASNPCRITFKGQTIVVCRDDLVEKLCRLAIHVPDNTKDIPQHFCDTIWSQRHFSPLPLHFNAVLPQFDYLFHLWPLPDVLIVADKFKSFVSCDAENSRLTINPGSFLLSNFEFQVYYPATGKVEASSLDIE